MHSWPITVFAPIEITPSWQRSLVPCPSHDQRPSSIRAPLRIWSTQRGPMKAMPSTCRRPWWRRRRQTSRRARSPYLGVSIPLEAMNRSSVSRPPWSGAGALRMTAGASSGGAATGSSWCSMRAKP